MDYISGVFTGLYFGVPIGALLIIAYVYLVIGTTAQLAFCGAVLAMAIGGLIFVVRRQVA